jgi:predicted DNA-binding protein (MmcQ/YjbR family)
MVSIDSFRKLALSLPGADEQPHFHLQSFRVKKKIFATLWQKENRAMLKLSLVDQSVFCSYGEAVFFPVPGAWGKQGATFVDLAKVRKDMFKDALTSAYNGVVSKLPGKKK